MEIDIWLLIGLLAQGCFFSRFLYQWIVSEKAKRIIIPKGFWYLSIFGALGLLAYAIYRNDPVFIIGQTGALFIYLRNITIESKQKAE